MQFDRRGLHLLEPSRKDLFQGVLDREGTAILDDDPAKPECVNNFETPVAGSLVSNAALPRVRAAWVLEG